MQSMHAFMRAYEAQKVVFVYLRGKQGLQATSCQCPAARAWAGSAQTPSRAALSACSAAGQHIKATGVQPEPEDDEEVLTKEEDWVVPGGYQDSLSSNTELGRAVKSACDELENLGGLERENLDQAEELLQKLGYTAKPQQDDQATDE